MPWEYKRVKVTQKREFDGGGEPCVETVIDPDALNTEGAQGWRWLQEVDETGHSIFEREVPVSSRGRCIREECQDTHVKYHALEVIMDKTRDCVVRMADLLGMPESIKGGRLPGLVAIVHVALKKRLEAINDE